MRSTVTMTLAWVVATSLAVLAASAAVRVVARQVSEDLPPTVPLEYLLPPSDDTGTAVAQADPTDTLPGRTPTPQASPSTVTGPDATPTGGPTPQPSPAAATRTIQTLGGSAGLVFDGGVVQILWATPNGGYTVSAEGAGSDEVRVEFRSEDHRSRIRAANVAGVPEIRVDEQGEGEDDGDVDDGSD